MGVPRQLKSAKLPRSAIKTLHVDQRALDVVAIIGRDEFDGPAMRATLGVDGGKAGLGALVQGLAQVA